jgi:hypothetical protein
LLLASGMALLLAAPLRTAHGPDGLRSLCRTAGADPQRDWLGSLHGWPDSFLVLNWRAFIAITKGRDVPSPCR